MKQQTLLVRDINGNTLFKADIETLYGVEEVARATVSSEDYIVIEVWPAEEPRCIQCGGGIDSHEDSCEILDALADAADALNDEAKTR